MNCKALKQYYVASVLAAALFTAAGLANAQTMRDAVEALRSDLRTDRKVIIAEQMNFTDRESEAFWPIYREYRAEAEKVSDGVVKLILEYGDLYPQVPEEKAKQMLKQYAKAEANLLSIKTKYLKKFGTVLPASKVFRFAQLDNRLDLGIRVGMASAIPLMPEGAKPPATEQR